MSRPRATEPYVQWKITLPAHLAAKFELLIWDAVLKKPRYAERQRILEGLIREYLARQDATQKAAP